MRIAMIGQRGLPATYGGIERHVEELAVRLVQRGHEVVVFCRRNYTTSRRPTYQGVRLVYSPTYPSKHLEAALHSGLSSARTVGHDFDIVHYHAVGPGIWSPIPRWLTGAKVVQTIHGLDQDRAKWGGFARRVLLVGDWLSKRVPHALIVVGGYLLDHYSDRRRLTVHIPNGVNMETRRDDSVLERHDLSAGNYALFVGRLIPEKAVDQLITAFSQVETAHRLVIVGGSSFTDSHEARLKALAAADPRVVLPGYVYGAELASLYANASLYVQPSLLEGLPLTVLEAMSHGLPIVLSDIPAHLEILPASRPGGRLFRAGEAAALVTQLAEGLAAAKDDRRAAEAAGERIRHDFNWDTVTDRTEQLYASVAG